MLLLDKYLKPSKFLIVICLVLFKNIFVSQNLIQNGGFENYSNIDCVYGGFNNNTTSLHVVDNWYSLSSPDYFNNSCASSSWYNAPNGIFGYCYPHQGNAHVGFMMFYEQSDTKEYIYQQLINPLQAGKIYCLNFYVSRADRKEYAVHSIGAYFSSNIQSVGTIGYVNANPQVINQSGFITDTIGWTQIQGCFTANGGEQYITIGNFNSNVNTDTLHTGTSNPIPSDNYYSYYYIDDITLIEQTTVGLENMNYELGVMNVYPNPANDILNIDIKNFNKENLSVNIFDVIGKEILKSDYKNQINISFLEKGIYFVSIQQDRKTLGVKKIIKE